MQDALRELMWNILRCEGDTVMAAEATEPFHDLGRPYDTDSNLVEFKEARDNNVYNFGVINGSLALLEQLFQKGYTLTTPTGEVINLESGKTLTETYGEGVWLHENKGI